MFTKATFNFLDELAANNDRIWFETNRPRYESLVREPALEFITAMGPVLERFAPQFCADPRKMGGSLMRVFRDTRFSRDKTPYKTNIGIQFRHTLGKRLCMHRGSTFMSQQTNAFSVRVAGTPKRLHWTAFVR